MLNNFSPQDAEKLTYEETGTKVHQETQAIGPKEGVSNVSQVNLRKPLQGSETNEARASSKMRTQKSVKFTPAVPVSLSE
jgi:hypothetical protein